MIDINSYKEYRGRLFNTLVYYTKEFKKAYTSNNKASVYFKNKIENTINLIFKVEKQIDLLNNRKDLIK